INPVRGVLRLMIHDSGNAVSDEDSLLGIDPTLPNQPTVFETILGGDWEGIPSAVSDSLSQGIKKAYDPNNILNPGILGD
ncbi:MAG TPA: hypothetical protein VK478_08320, partial [Gemmatimonadaceae bacterium]|nr:hypothetical protein [Gemmatimonadaceae bacterium]